MYIIIIPISGCLWDKVNEKGILLLGTGLFVVASYPLFFRSLSGSFESQILSQSLLAAITGFFVGPLGYAAAERFPTSARYTGISFNFKYRCCFIWWLSTHDSSVDRTHHP